MRKNQKLICDIKTGHGIIMHMVKNQLLFAHKAKTILSKQIQLTIEVLQISNRWQCVNQVYSVVYLGISPK